MRSRQAWTIGAAAVVLTMAGAAGPASAAQNPELVSITSDGYPLSETAEEGEISDGGTRVLFHTMTNGQPPALFYLRNRAAGTTIVEHETAPDIWPGHADLSGNGRYLAFGQRPDGESGFDLRVHDLVDGSVDVVQDNIGITRPSLSDNGRKIAYVRPYEANNTPTIFVKNLDTGAATRMTSNAHASSPLLSGDGTKVAYTQYGHVYLRDVATKRLTRIDVRPNGTFGQPGSATPRGISDNGNYVLFATSATDIRPGTSACAADPEEACIYRRNIVDARSTLASILPNGQIAPSLFGRADLSGDGRVVAFQVLGDRLGIYVRVLSTAKTRLASINAAGQAANRGASDPTLSQDGGLVTFHSNATNFGYPDIIDGQLWVARGK